MPEQSYENHRRFVPAFHFLLSGILFLTLIGSAVNLWVSFRRDAPLYDPALLLVLVIVAMMLFWYVRVFPLKAQDRAIRAEENLRHYVLTGQLFDPRVTTRQIIGLRFASDEELAELAARAAEEGLTEDQIKRAVEKWRADDYRV